MPSITLVGRTSALEFREFESGAKRYRFTLSINPGVQPPLLIKCEGWGIRVAEQFELMEEGSLVGINGTMTKSNVGALPLVRIDRLEYLGKPLAKVEG